MFECIKALKPHAEIIVFTASHYTYADTILDYLDPDRSLFDLRLYRRNCVKTPENLYVKDLRILKNRDFKDICLIDNAAYSFSF